MSYSCKSALLCTKLFQGRWHMSRVHSMTYLIVVIYQYIGYKHITTTQSFREWRTYRTLAIFR